MLLDGRHYLHLGLPKVNLILSIDEHNFGFDSRKRVEVDFIQYLQKYSFILLIQPEFDIVEHYLLRYHPSKVGNILSTCLPKEAAVKLELLFHQG